MEPGMSIVNQINAGLNDVRGALIALVGGEPFVDDEKHLKVKAYYQLGEIIRMVEDHRGGQSIPWSDRKLRVEEEFS